MNSKSFGATVTTLLFYLLFPVSAEAWLGKVSGVIDGDTIEVIRDGHKVIVHLYGIDCPEKEQDYGHAAKNFTADKVTGKMVDVNPVGEASLMAKDRYGPTEALVSVDGFSLNEEMVGNGFAWVDNRHCTKDYCYRWKAIEIHVKGEAVSPRR